MALAVTLMVPPVGDTAWILNAGKVLLLDMLVTFVNSSKCMLQ